MKTILISFLLLSASLLAMHFSARLRGRNFKKGCCSSLPDEVTGKNHSTGQKGKTA